MCLRQNSHVDRFGNLGKKPVLQCVFTCVDRSSNATVIVFCQWNQNELRKWKRGNLTNSKIHHTNFVHVLRSISPLLLCVSVRGKRNICFSVRLFVCIASQWALYSVSLPCACESQQYSEKHTHTHQLLFKGRQNRVYTIAFCLFS